MPQHAELPDLERLSGTPDAPLAEEDRPARIELDKHGDDCEERRKDEQTHRCAGKCRNYA